MIERISTNKGNSRAAQTAGSVSMAGGLFLVIAGAGAWTAVSKQLAGEGITVAADARAKAGATVKGPIGAFAQAEAVQRHSMQASGGKPFAELEQDDPVREVLLQAATVRTALLTSVISFGVAALAVGTGALSVLAGYSLAASGRDK